MRPRRQSASLSATLGAERKDREQMRRLLSQPQKPAVAAAATPTPSGGGIVGMAEVYAMAGSVTMAAGVAQMDYQSVTYDAPYDPFGGAALSWLTVTDYRLTLTPGWYNLAASFRLGWTSQSGAPTSLSTYVQGGANAVHNDASYFALADIGTPGFAEWGVRQVVSAGPTYIAEGQDVWFECRPAPSPTTSSSTGTLVWNITKYG